MTSDQTRRPKYWGGVKLDAKEKAMVLAYIKHFKFDREKVVAAYRSGDDERIWVESEKLYPYLSPNWHKAGKDVCLVCGYVTSVTNICRNAKENGWPNVNRAFPMLAIKDIPFLIKRRPKP